MKFQILLFLLFLTSISFAQNEKVTDAELEAMIEDPPKAQSQIRDIDSGIMVDRHNVLNDQNRISLLYHGNTNLYEFAKISGLEFNYGSHFRDYWLEFFYLRTQAEFNNIVHTVGGTTGESDDSLNTFGVGISMRGAWIQELVNSESIYTHSAANFGYYTLNQSSSNTSYSGPGFKADFGIHVRSSKTMHYGLRTTYHLAHVKREALFANESSSSRSLLLTWMTIGIDLSFYF